MEDDLAYLEKDPVTTLEYVKFLEFIEAAQSRLDEMETELDYCKELYDIMEEFQIKIPFDDMKRYLGISVEMGTLRNAVDCKAEDRARLIKMFNNALNKDISALIGEVGTIKDQCIVSFIYSIFWISSLGKDSKVILNKLLIFLICNHAPMFSTIFWKLPWILSLSKDSKILLNQLLIFSTLLYYFSSYIFDILRKSLILKSLTSQKQLKIEIYVFSNHGYTT